MVQEHRLVFLAVHPQESKADIICQRLCLSCSVLHWASWFIGLVPLHLTLSIHQAVTPGSEFHLCTPQRISFANKRLFKTKRTRTKGTALSTGGTILEKYNEHSLTRSRVVKNKSYSCILRAGECFYVS